MIRSAAEEIKTHFWERDLLNRTLMKQLENAGFPYAGFAVRDDRFYDIIREVRAEMN